LPIEESTVFETGKTYKRKEDLHEIYGGQRQGGVSTPLGQAFVVLFTRQAGETYGYAGEFRPDGIFWYTGKGQVGDMEMAKGNFVIKSRAAPKPYHRGDGG
jgi:5-methylcytosine-specific restriction protein A